MALFSSTAVSVCPERGDGFDPVTQIGDQQPEQHRHVGLIHRHTAHMIVFFNVYMHDVNFNKHHAY